jgi:hypothetical protein
VHYCLLCALYDIICVYFKSVDINECDEKLRVCEDQSYCVNLPGSSTCAGE